MGGTLTPTSIRQTPLTVIAQRGHRTQFPQSTIEPPFDHLPVPSRDALSVTVSCCVCKRLDNHTIEGRPTPAVVPFQRLTQASTYGRSVLDVKLLEVKGEMMPSGEASKRPASNRSSNNLRSHTQRHDPSTACARHLGPRNNSGVDLYRVNLRFSHLQPFGSVAFPFSETRKTALKQPIFVDELFDELLTSSCNVSSGDVRRIASG